MIHRDQCAAIAEGCDILVATLGKLVDFIKQGKVKLAECGYVVLDEADRLLCMGFELAARFTIQGTDLRKHQTAMFSATYPRDIRILANDLLTDPLQIEIGQIGSTTSDIHQVVMHVQQKGKAEQLVRLLREANRKNTVASPYLILVFVRTRKDAIQRTIDLERSGMPALKRFRAGSPNVLVATDVAQRALDIPNVMHVIQFDLPGDISDYIQRIGRTGRAGNEGLATCFWNVKHVPCKHQIPS
ncbi:DEAD-box ATP-dependent RNA helicase [Thoreauomyces humboldtii]|nr:DEAD-box ATP-dependent RNA helicase [Thoreauomyces humboldtii]